MRKSVLIFGCATLLVVGLVWIMSRTSGRDRGTAEMVAEQELKEFGLYYQSFRDAHDGKAPATLQELLDEGDYLGRVVEPYRTKTISRIEYPVKHLPVHVPQSLVLAAYHTGEYGSFYLLYDGTYQSVRVVSAQQLPATPPSYP